MQNGQASWFALGLMFSVTAADAFHQMHDSTGGDPATTQPVPCGFEPEMRQNMSNLQTVLKATDAIGRCSEGTGARRADSDHHDSGPHGEVICGDRGNDTPRAPCQITESCRRPTPCSVP